MNRRKLSITVAAAAFIAVGTVTITPDQAAFIDFNFTTARGATGTFTLNTFCIPAPLENIHTLLVRSRQLDADLEQLPILK